MTLLTKTGAVALGILVATTAAASAMSRTEERLALQMYEIEKGRQSGTITWREGLKLRKEQREIVRLENELSADGRVTAKERRMLNKMQNKAARHIAIEARDGWYRWWWLPRVGR
jgi:hypothetical protein